MGKKKNPLAKTSEERKMLRKCMSVATKALLNSCNQKHNRPHLSVRSSEYDENGAHWVGLDVTIHGVELAIYLFTIFETGCSVEVICNGQSTDKYLYSGKALELLKSFLIFNGYGNAV